LFYFLESPCVVIAPEMMLHSSNHIELLFLVPPKIVLGGKYARPVASSSPFNFFDFPCRRRSDDKNLFGGSSRPILLRRWQVLSLISWLGRLLTFPPTSRLLTRWEAALTRFTPPHLFFLFGHGLTFRLSSCYGTWAPKLTKLSNQTGPTKSSPLLSGKYGEFLGCVFLFWFFFFFSFLCFFFFCVLSWVLSFLASR